MKQIANNSRDDLVIPSVRRSTGGQWGSFVIRPGVVTLHDDHWAAIQALEQPMPDALSMALHDGVLAEVAPRQRPDPEVVAAMLDALPEAPPDETHVSIDLPDEPEPEIKKKKAPAKKKAAKK